MQTQDRNGYPITAEGGGSFVRVEARNPLVAGRTICYRGLVIAVSSDAKGALVELSSWRGGRFTGRRMMARPETCEVVRAPAALRHEQTAKARRQIG